MTQDTHHRCSQNIRRSALLSCCLTFLSIKKKTWLLSLNSTFYTPPPPIRPLWLSGRKEPIINAPPTHSNYPPLPNLLAFRCTCMPLCLYFIAIHLFLGFHIWSCKYIRKAHPHKEQTMTLPWLCLCPAQQGVCRHHSRSPPSSPPPSSPRPPPPPQTPWTRQTFVSQLRTVGVNKMKKVQEFTPSCSVVNVGKMDTVK